MVCLNKILRESNRFDDLSSASDFLGSFNARKLFCTSERMKFSYALICRLRHEVNEEAFNLNCKEDYIRTKYEW